MTSSSQSGPGLAAILVRGFFILAVLAFAGFGVVSLVKPTALLQGAPAEVGVGIFARYLAMRNLPIAALGLVAVLRRDRVLIGHLSLLLGIIQALDAALGVYDGHPTHAIGPVVLSLGYLLSARFLLRAEA